jgi:hypothetical protein
MTMTFLMRISLWRNSIQTLPHLSLLLQRKSFVKLLPRRPQCGMNGQKLCCCCPPAKRNGPLTLASHVNTPTHIDTICRSSGRLLLSLLLLGIIG